MNNSTLLIEVLVLCEPFRDERYLNCHYEKDDKDCDLIDLFHFIQRDANIDDLEQFELTTRLYQALKHKDVNQYIKLLDMISSSLVVVVDDRVVLRQNEFTSMETNQNSKKSLDIFSTYSDQYKILIWYYFSRFMSTDLLSIAYLVCHDYDIFPYLHRTLSFPKIGDKLFNHMIEKGIAETHVHLNGSVHYEEQFWYLVCKRNTFSAKVNFLYKIKSLNVIVKKDVDLELNLLVASIIRFYLCEYMHSKGYNKFELFIQKKQIIHIFYDFLINGFQEQSKKPQRRNELLDELKKIERRVGVALSDNESSEFKEDYLSIFYEHLHLKGKENEYLFVYECMKYLKNNNQDKMFFALFRRYIIIKNVLANYKIQGGLVKGLTYFHYFFSGQNGIIPLKDRYQIVFSHYGELDCVRRLELRKSFTIPKNTNLIKLKAKVANDILMFLVEYNKWLKKQTNDRTMSIALIYHFSKREAVSNPCVHRYLETHDVRMLPNGLLQRQYEQCVIALKQLFKEIPNLKKFVVGIDAASNENKSEPSVFSPIFLLLRNKYRQHKPKFYDKDDRQSMESLGFTYHVGEIFNVLLSGYRHIDEVITQFHFKSGDRLGHATALMIDIDEYLKSRQSSKIEAGEQLKNLLYLFHLKKDSGMLFRYDSSRLINQIQKIAYIIFEDENINVQELYRWYISTFEFEDVTVKEIERCQLFCKKNSNMGKLTAWNLQRLITASNCEYYRNRMKQVVCIEESSSQSLLYHEVQEYLVKKIQELGVIIESNPISNSRIGEISNEFEVPLRNVNTLFLDENHQKRVMLTISSDDPAVFNTNIVYQYYLLKQQLIIHGYATEEVLMWLNQLRENGMRASFIDWNYDRKELINVVESTINELKKFLGKI